MVLPDISYRRQVDGVSQKLHASIINMHVIEIFIVNWKWILLSTSPSAILH
jgi:hypothetical protein